MNRRGLVATLVAAAAAGPRMARAQPRPLPVVGFLGHATAAEMADRIVAFLAGLKDAGYVVGQNVAIEYRWAEDDNARLPALARDLVQRNVSVIFTIGPNGILAAGNATSTIPIVILGATDLVALGLAASYSKPGRNVTGFTIMALELMPKRLALLSDLVPKARVIPLLFNPTGTDQWLPGVEGVARVKGVRLPILLATNPAEIDAAFATLAEHHADALLVGSDPLFNNRRAQIVALVARYAIPTMHDLRESVVLGGLVSYGPSLPGIYRQSGTYVGRILSGAKPGDLPIQEPSKFEFVINLRTAKALNLAIPQRVLDTADELIE